MTEQQRQPIKLQFAELDPKTDERGRERKQSPTVEFRNGDYFRKFEAKDAPFDIVGVTHTDKGSDDKERIVVDMSAEEEAAMLVRSGHFVLVEEPKEETSTAPDEAKSSKPKNQGKIGGAPATGE